MKKIYTMRLFAFLFVALLGTLGAKAQKLLEFNNTKDFYPKSGEKYYFTPESNGTLRWAVYLNEVAINTFVTGGIYSAETNELMAPSNLNGTDWGWAYELDWAEYYLLSGKEYYFQWSKNGDSDEYVLYVTWSGSTAPPVEEEWNAIEFYDSDSQVYNTKPYNLYLDMEPGVLVIEQAGEMSSQLYSDQACTTSDLVNYDLSTGAELFTLTYYNLEPGKRYYYKSNSVEQVKFSLKDDIEKWHELQLMTLYTSASKPYNLYFNVVNPGELVVYQKGTDQSQLYSSIECTDEDLIQFNERHHEDDTYSLHYSELVVGNTYYFKSETVTQVEFSYDVDPSAFNIKLDVPFVYPALTGDDYSFTCPFNGVLVIKTNTAEPYIFLSGPDTFVSTIFYSSPNEEDNMEILEMLGGENDPKSYTFNVKKGITYYFNPSLWENQEFLFSIYDNADLDFFNVLEPAEGSTILGFIKGEPLKFGFKEEPETFDIIFYNENDNVITSFSKSDLEFFTTDASGNHIFEPPVDNYFANYVRYESGKRYKVEFIKNPQYSRAASDMESKTVYYYGDTPVKVEEVPAANVDGVYNVFNLQGINVLNTTNYSDVNSLPKGLYIVNNHKVLVK